MNILDTCQHGETDELKNIYNLFTGKITASNILVLQILYKTKLVGFFVRSIAFVPMFTLILLETGA